MQININFILFYSISFYFIVDPITESTFYLLLPTGKQHLLDCVSKYLESPVMTGHTVGCLAMSGFWAPNLLSL